MPRVRKGEAAKSVDDVLSELGMDPELPPEQASQDFMRSSLTVEKVETKAAEPDDEEDDDFEDDDEDDEDDDEEVAVSPSRAKERPSDFFPAVPSKPAPKLTPVNTIPDPDPEPDPLPFIAPPPPPTPIKAKAKANAPSTSKLGKGLASKVPGAERIKVYKRQDSGQLGHIGDYRARDLEGCVDIEDFIARYVKPKFGAGEYQLKGIDAYGREMEVGSVFMLDPPGVSEAGGAFGLAQSLMAQQREFMREQMARMQQTPPATPAVDPITMLRNVMALSDSVTQKAKEEKERGAAEMNGTMSSMMQMFMMSMQQQQQQTMQMMAMLAAPREDPTMKMLLAKLVEEKTSSRGDGLPPPPPPPPAADPMEGIAKLITALAAAGLVGNHGGGNSGDDEVKEILKAQIAARESERLTFKDVIGMMQEMRQERGTDDFKKSADNLAMMLNITNQLRQSTEGGATAGFFDALAALFGNRDFAGSIAGAIRSKASTTQQQQLVAQNQQTVLQQRALAQAAAQRQQIIAEAQRSLHSTPPAPIAATPQAVATPAATPAAAPVAPIAQARRPQIQLPPLPANTSEHINNIVAAKDDDAALMGACVSLLMYLSEFPDWTGFTTKLLGAAQSGNKREMLQYLALLFEGLVSMGLVEIEVAKRALSAANQHFDVIHAKLGNDGSGGVIPEEEDEEIDFLASEDDEDDEEEGGDFDTAQL